MDDQPADIGAPQGRWNKLVRRARLGDPKKKAAALVIGSYADGDGTSVKCGVARLAADCEMGYSTARRYMSWLREVGLIEMVRAGNGKHGSRSDEYRLTIAAHTEKALNALSQSEYDDLVGGMRATNSQAEKARRLRAESTPTALTHEVSAVARESGEATALTQRTERSNPLLRSPMGELPPKEQRSPPTGGAPPPGPRRPEPPPSSGSRLGAEQEISAAHHPAQDLQRKSLPRTRAPLAPVISLDSRRIS